MHNQIEKSSTTGQFPTNQKETLSQNRPQPQAPCKLPAYPSNGHLKSSKWVFRQISPSRFQLPTCCSLGAFNAECKDPLNLDFLQKPHNSFCLVLKCP